MSELSLDQLAAGIQAQFGAISDDISLLRAQVKQVRDTFLRSTLTDVETVVNTIDTNVDTVNTTTGTINTTTGTINTNVGTVLAIVPTLQLGDTIDSMVYPADRYYAAYGVLDASTSAPFWGAVTGGTFQQWDGTQTQQYLRLAGAGGSSIGPGDPDFIYPLGPFGNSPSYAPKNATPTSVDIWFTARFNANADYATYGIGAHFGGSLPFSNTAHHFIQVLRNTSNWELGSCDGATISQSSAAGGNGNWHEFRVNWTAASLMLYVDGVSTITKSTNMPTRPLGIGVISQDATNTIDIVDYLVEWD